MDTPTNPLEAIGFLTVVEAPPVGWFGGYLVLSRLGRPLEFRCSTPVQASRAQTILYGPTLRQYLAADVIGCTVLASSKISVPLVVTDDPDCLPLALLRPETVVCTARRSSADAEPSPSSAPPASPRAEAAAPFYCLGEYELTWSGAAATYPEQILAQVASFAEHIDLMEPFERIRAALGEIQQAADHDADEAAGDAVGAA